MEYLCCLAAPPGRMRWCVKVESEQVSELLEWVEVEQQSCSRSKVQWMVEQWEEPGAEAEAAVEMSVAVGQCSSIREHMIHSTNLWWL